ncbi:glycosyltransferase [Rickettsia endosymbiont of Halotydeus destructor]|uniref:glycosyltransferase n=1 Tax=Rickettsia endosymbiont of Halotydeus destructor TaxID=2996754 RepID=UPI003BB0D54B
MKENNPLISVVMASYNHGLYVKEAIYSVLNQTFQDFEIIITDDGSTDNTVAVIQNIQNKKIKFFIFEHNQGACAAINNSISMAKGEYIAVINSDDVWVKDKLQKQISFLLDNRKIDAVFSSALFLDENMKPFKAEEKPFFSDIFQQNNRSSGQWLKRFFFEGNCLCHPSILIKKKCYDVLGLYDNRYRQLPDLDMWIKFCKKFQLHVLPEQLVKFRILKNNKNTSSPSLENQIRGRTEAHLIMRSFFDEMPIAVFKEGFKDFLYNKDFVGSEEYEIEKAFLYLRMGCYNIFAIEKLYNWLKDTDIRYILITKYNFDDKKFWEIASLNGSFNQEVSGRALLKSLFNKIVHTSKKQVLMSGIKYIKLLLINRK